MYKPGLRVVNQSQFKCSNPYSTLRKTSFWSTKFTDSTSCKAVHYCKIYLVKAYQNWKEPQSCVDWLIFCPFWCQWHFCDWLQLHPNFFPSTFCTWTDTFFFEESYLFCDKLWDGRACGLDLCLKEIVCRSSSFTPWEYYTSLLKCFITKYRW